MRNFNRKLTPKVVGGAVLRKNNHAKTSNYWNTAQENVIIDIEKPGNGYKHFLKKKDVLKFLELIPNWKKFSQDLDAIVLAEAGEGWDGYYNNDGVICIAAWEKDLDVLLDNEYYADHKKLLDRLKVSCTKMKDGYYCEFSVNQIKAFQLLHILLHELGHHYDRIKTKSKYESSRGEQFAEDFAFKYEEQMWIDYQDAFNIVF